MQFVYDFQQKINKDIYIKIVYNKIMEKIPTSNGVKGRAANMKKKTDGKVVAGGRHDKGKIYVDELYFRHVDQVERWRQEYEHHQLLENKLAKFSIFNYEEVDYAPQLVRTIFKERPIPDFSYMVEEARVKAQSKFLMPLMIHLVALVILVIILIVSNNTILLWGSGASVVIVLILLALMVEGRNTYINKVVGEKQQEVTARIAYEEKKIMEEKKKHDDNEEERIHLIEQLLSGEAPAILAKIERVLLGIAFPFYLSVDIELYNDIPAVKIWLPPKSLIPIQICTLTSAGRLNFEDKSIRVINRQYLELCAALVIKIMSTIYSHIPTFNTGYVYAMSKEGLNVECLIAAKLDRQTLVGVCEAENGLTAIQRAQAKFECDTSLMLLPVGCSQPEEWGDVEQKSISYIRINSFV